jgi:hypothetical protein
MHVLEGRGLIAIHDGETAKTPRRGHEQSLAKGRGGDAPGEGQALAAPARLAGGGRLLGDEQVVQTRGSGEADVEGRVLCSEALRVNSGIRACLRERKVEQLVGLMEISHKEGCHTIDACLETLLKHEYITHHDAVQNCRDERRFSSENLAARSAVKK